MRDAKTTPIIIAVLIPIAAVAVALGMVYLKKQNVSGLEDFSYPLYMQNPSGLNGNKYLLKAQLDMQLADLGNFKIVSVKTPDEMSKFAVAIPSRISENLITRQRYKMVVRIGEGGQIYVDSMEKY